MGSNSIIASPMLITHTSPRSLWSSSSSSSVPVPTTSEAWILNAAVTPTIKFRHPSETYILYSILIFSLLQLVQWAQGWGFICVAEPISFTLSCTEGSFLVNTLMSYTLFWHYGLWSLFIISCSPHLISPAINNKKLVLIICKSTHTYKIGDKDQGPAVCSHVVVFFQNPDDN